MITTDDIMVLAAAWSAAIATRADAAPPQDELRAAVAALVAERDALKRAIQNYRDTLQDVRGHYERACTERDSLRQDAERFRAIRQCRKTVQLYVYEAADDPFSGGWSYKNDPEDFDKFADAAMGEQK